MKLICPACGREIGAGDANVDTGIAKCVGCGEVMNLFEVLGLPMPERGVVVSGGGAEGVAAMPRGVRVEETGVMWAARWRWFRGEYLVMLLFCAVWDGFLVFWYSVAVRMKGGPINWFALAFPALHVLSGVWMTYSVLAGLLNWTEVRVDDQVLSVRHWPVPWKGKRLATGLIEQLYVRKKAGGKDIRNMNAAYELCAMVQGTSEKLLGVESVERGKFLEYGIERRLGIEPRAVAGECLAG